MNLCPVSIPFLFLCFLAAHGENPPHFTGEVSINCGSSGTSSALNGKKWLGDKEPKFSSLLQIRGLSSTSSTVIRKFSSVDPVPYRTARISRSKFSYEFQVSPGQKIIRLHFQSIPYRGFKEFKDLFTVESHPFTLLGNFSASLTAYGLGVNSFVKEFCLNVLENGKLSISFSPSSFDAYAFINGIEIISVPASLSYFHAGDVGVQVVGQKSPVYVDHDNALEIIYRLNTKKSLLPTTRDFDDMFPMWAIQKLDEEKNSTWKIPVDVGFRYLIRVHFSEIALKIMESDDVIFKVFINEMVIHTNIDIVKERSDNNIPWYRDYMVTMRGNKEERKRDLLISLQSYDELINGHGLLAGFEILKLGNPDNSLASPNPFSPMQDSPYSFLVLRHKNAIATIAITIIALVNIIVHKSREILEDSSIEEENKPSANAERFCRRFSLVEIKLATENFSDALLIGKGGFGRVYKGFIDKEQSTIAVKRLKPSSNQGSHEFLTEIEMLSELRHVNLVSLIGYCNEHGEMILVYDYMAYGTLANCLYKLQREGNTCCSLMWKQRLDICIGAGRGLDYLHTGHGIIHRDVKASNILLDENFIAKVSDFGLAKAKDRSKLKSYVSTKVKGTFGYLDPYYLSTHKLTRKSDTYAFGVVLLEVLCGRPAVNSRVAENERILSKWAQDNIRKGQVDQIVASCLREEMSPDSLKTFVGVVERCLSDEPKNRPTMSQVVLQLEFALEQQENKQNLVLNETSIVHDDIRPCNNEIDVLVTKDKLTMASQEGQNITPPTKDQTRGNMVNIELLTKKTYGRRAPIHKRLRHWSRYGFWNRIKPSMKNESSLCGMKQNESLHTNGSSILLSSYLCRRFLLEEIKTATSNFQDNFIIGKGGYGNVYKGFIDDGATTVAIKRLNSCSNQGAREFLTEIEMLSKLSYLHLVSLIGYCDENGEMILVYEYMAHGTLRDHLYSIDNSPLKWKQRLQICISTAKGLCYLHTSGERAIIHRDIKSTNILLDEKWVAKISDFGLSKVGPTGDFFTHVSTVVKGSIGYVDPEYYKRQQLTHKSDIYSFGVVLFEVLCARPVVIPSFPREQASLAEWGELCYRRGTIEQIIDSNLKGQIAPECLSKFVEIGVMCLRENGVNRPAINDVIWSLEHAMQLQEEAENRGWDAMDRGESLNGMKK